LKTNPQELKRNTIMSEAGVKRECGESVRGEQGREQDPAGRTAAQTTACCGPEVAKMMQDCPCGAAMRGHWKTALVAVGLVFLAFLVGQVGGILGAIAFFRTI
jgi:hypothetical protein